MTCPNCAALQPKISRPIFARQQAQSPQWANLAWKPHKPRQRPALARQMAFFALYPLYAGRRVRLACDIFHQHSILGIAHI